MKKIIRLTESDLKRIVRRVLNEQPTGEWDIAVEFCKELESWWEGSSNWFMDPDTEYTEFFKRFQDSTDDDDVTAAQAYEYMIMEKFNKTINKKNKYYGQILDWIDRIIDEIDDAFQNPQELLLKGPEGKTEYFTVDPEIDV